MTVDNKDLLGIDKGLRENEFGQLVSKDPQYSLPTNVASRETIYNGNNRHGARHNGSSRRPRY